MITDSMLDQLVATANASATTTAADRGFTPIFDSLVNQMGLVMSWGSFTA